MELAYAIEFHLKAALGEVKLDDSDQRLVESSHDLPRIFGLCRKYDVLASARVSLDFLCLARDHFERRYPRGEQALMDREKYMRDGQDTLPVYDDCIIQLDLALAADYETTDFLLGTGALHGFPFIPALAESIFAGNVFAYQHADMYMKQPAWSNSAATPGCPNRDPRELSGPAPTGEWRGQVGADALLKSRLAELYRYPRRGDPDPNPARLIPSFQRRLPIYTPEWVVKRAIAHFGSENVDVIEEGHAPRKRIDLVVFDRGATRWWKRLALRYDFYELWRDSPATRMRLQRWFKEAEEQFRERWNGKPASDRIPRQTAVRHPLYWTRHAKQ